MLYLSDQFIQITDHLLHTMAQMRYRIVPRDLYIASQITRSGRRNHAAYDVHVTLQGLHGAQLFLTCLTNIANCILQFIGQLTDCVLTGKAHLNGVIPIGHLGHDH